MKPLVRELVRCLFRVVQAVFWRVDARLRPPPQDPWPMGEALAEIERNQRASR